MIKLPVVCKSFLLSNPLYYFCLAKKTQMEIPMQIKGLFHEKTK